MRYLSSLVPILLGLVYCLKTAALELSPLDVSKSFAGNKTGLILSVHVSTSGVWLGTENGLFGLIGQKVVRVSKTSSAGLLQSNYITDVEELADGRLIFVAYGDGIYTVVPGHSKPEKVNFIPEDIHVSAWRLSVKGNELYVNSGIDIDAYDLTLNKQIMSLSDMLRGTNRNVISFDLSSDSSLWWIEERNGIFAYSKTDNEITSYSIEEFLPEASTVTALLVEEDALYVGSDIGLHRINLIDNNVVHLIKRPTSDASLKKEPFFEIKRSPNGTLWAAAEKLYIVNEKHNKLETPTYLYPSLQKSVINIVWRFAFDEYGNFYGADTQRGLFVIPHSTEKLKVLSHEGKIENSSISDLLFNGESRFWYLTPGHLTRYDESTGESFRVSLPKNTESWFLAKTEETLTLVNREGEVFQISSDMDGLVKKSNILKTNNISGSIVNTAIGSAGTFLTINSKRGINLYRFIEGKLIPIPLSNAVSLLSNHNPEGSIYAGVTGEGGYQLSKNNDDVRIKKVFEKLGWGTVCLHSQQGEKIWACSTGEGAILHSAAYEAPLHILNDKVIRGIGSISDDEILIATNTGLYYFNMKSDAMVALDRSFGITDSDFEYDAIRSSQLISLVRGDRFTYVINHESLKSNIDSYLKKEATIHFYEAISYTKEEHSSRELLADINTIKQKRNVIRLDYDFNNLALKFTVTDRLDHEDYTVGYRVEGLNESWNNLDSREGVVLENIPPGSYILQIRAKREIFENNGFYRSITIIVAPPWWQTPYAYAAYFLAGLLVLIYAVLQIKARVAARNEELAEKVDEQKQALEQNQTYIRTILKRKHRALLNVAKEIQTPLTLILGPLQLVQDQPNDVDNPRRINVIARNARRLHLLINQFTEVERLESSKSLPRQSYPIKEHFPVLLANLEPEITRKAIKLTARLKATGFISLLPESLEKIVYNLVRNAIAASPHGGEVTIETRCEALQLVIVVKDSGEALSESDAADVLERFAQNDADSEEEWLPGLAIAKEASLANSGWIGIDSKPGRGNRLSVYLPLINLSEEMPLSPPMVVDVVPRIPRIDDQRPIVLIVDDNPDMRQYLKDTLRLSYNCMEASQGKQALKTMQVIVPDLVISDGHMPECDGFALREAMLKTPALEDIPFILINDEQSDDMLEQCVELNIDSILEKPVEAATLRYTTGQLLSLLSRNKKATAPVTESSPFDVPAFTNAKDQAFYTGFMQVLSKHYHDEAFNKCDAASLMAVSERQLSRKLLALFKMNFSEILKHYRIFNAKKLLDEGKQVTQVAYDVGFSTVSYFSRSFKIQCNETPSQYQERKVSSEAS